MSRNPGGCDDSLIESATLIRTVRLSAWQRGRNSDGGAGGRDRR